MRSRQFLAAGDRFGTWTVLGFSHLEGTSDLYDCRCDCGRESKVRKSHMRSGASLRCKSCATSTHGMSKSSEFHIWQTMKERCENANFSQFQRYGGRGIRVCASWSGSFERFFADVGPRPSASHSIDRIDNDGPYEPGNCRWATKVEQAQNRRSTRRLTIDGRTLCVAEWSRVSGANNQTIHERLKRGWPEKDAVYGRQESP